MSTVREKDHVGIFLDKERRLIHLGISSTQLADQFGAALIKKLKRAGVLRPIINPEDLKRNIFDESSLAKVVYARYLLEKAKQHHDRWIPFERIVGIIPQDCFEEMLTQPWWDEKVNTIIRDRAWGFDITPYIKSFVRPVAQHGK